MFEDIVVVGVFVLVVVVVVGALLQGWLGPFCRAGGGLVQGSRQSQLYFLPGESELSVAVWG